MPLNASAFDQFTAMVSVRLDSGAGCAGFGWAERLDVMWEKLVGWEGQGCIMFLSFR